MQTNTIMASEINTSTHSHNETFQMKHIMYKYNTPARKHSMLICIHKPKKHNRTEIQMASLRRYTQKPTSLSPLPLSQKAAMVAVGWAGYTQSQKHTRHTINYPIHGPRNTQHTMIIVYTIQTVTQKHITIIQCRPRNTQHTIIVQYTDPEMHHNILYL